MANFWADDEDDVMLSWPDTCSICLSDKHLKTVAENPPVFIIECYNCGHTFEWINRREETNDNF